MTMHPELFLAGRWVTRTTRLPVDDPSTGAVVGSVAAAEPQDVEDAVAAAHEAFDSWSRTEPAERAAILTALADAMAAREQEFASLITTEMGAPADFSLEVQTRLAIDVIRSYATLLDTFEWSEPVPGGDDGGGAQGVVVREAAGVVAAITPWNYPLLPDRRQAGRGSGGRLRGGAEAERRSHRWTPSCWPSAPRPPGSRPGCSAVLSGRRRWQWAVLAGTRASTWSRSPARPRSAAGRRGRAADSVKRVGLELGGKSAAVVLPGLSGPSWPARSRRQSDNVFANTGQTCTALTRLLVPAERYEEAVAAAVAAGAPYTLGDPSRPGAHLGPSASAAQRDAVLDHLRTAVKEGATVVLGGADTPELPSHLRHLSGGYWVRPTILADVTPQMRIAREEVFGPVLCLIPYRDEAEALRLANDSDYGLSGAVWAADRDRALAFARRMRTGRVQVNGGGYNLHAPTGGYKRSGIGRELGRWGLEEFTEVKSLMVETP